ncbi:unnamed protein product [Dovyalis caffra]|uniref:Peptidase metallopeptidase domain-containing protein n=1 Tax=Dovyalis caffra TaxID=77055 RepID=A0AAV1RLD1_9ROSI|nr:unnamed protein product [Dovyalis caffra]
MASKTFYFITFTSLHLLPYLFHSISAHPTVQEQSPFQFIKHVQGCKKGDNMKGIHSLKKHLHRFGYLEHKHAINSTKDTGDHFDEHVEIAIKTYQINFNLKPTGVLDPETVAQMIMPRCGVPDIIDGKTRMKAAGTYNIKYAFFNGSPKWPLFKKVLNWGLRPGIRRDVISPLVEFAFLSWSGVTPFAYNFVDENLTVADIKIGFTSRSAGDQILDGPGGQLAYANPPTAGTFYYDSDEKWSDGPVPGAYDMGSVGLHELGHVLGLAHSSVENAAMWPSLKSGITKGLAADDIQGMKTLYGS